MEDINDNTRNTYIIRRKLAELRKRPDENYFDYWVGDKFRVLIYTREIQDLGNDDPNDRILSHATVDVSVYDVKKMPDGFLSTTNFIYLDKDSRFTNYEPIQHLKYSKATGRQMPINNVCELIKYLHIISKLTVFL